MRMVVFCHSLQSDWNHGNAHFLRGVVTELLSRGHRVDVYEPRDAWSVRHLVAEHGQAPLDAFRRRFPHLTSTPFSLDSLDLDRVLAEADLVLVHEWSDPALVASLGQRRRRTKRWRLLFHDTHHRSVTDPAAMSAFDLEHYDGVLAFGNVVRGLYLSNGWAQRAWTWHEAADTHVFRPLPDAAGAPPEGDLVWIGNWGDEERTAELHEFLIQPVRDLGLRARVYGVRYPEAARRALAAAGIDYAGWLPNWRVPEVFARYRVTVHVPRRPYVEKLPGIPTIRPFEALACGVPLVCAPWSDAEGLFRPGLDFRMVPDGAAMSQTLDHLLSHPEAAAAQAARGRETILARHTCAHRVDELLAICADLGLQAGRHGRLAQPARHGLAAGA